MNSNDNSEFRLSLAKRALSKAEKASREKIWEDCLGHAQEAVENAGKSILGHVGPIPRTHDILEPLTDLVKTDKLPLSLRDVLHATLDAFTEMGTKTHMLAAYGDEETGTPPWELINESTAQAALDKAHRAVARAEIIFDEMTKPPPSPDAQKN